VLIHFFCVFYATGADGGRGGSAPLPMHNPLSSPSAEIDTTAVAASPAGVLRNPHVNLGASTAE
jgi:hypothetical protein